MTRCLHLPQLLQQLVPKGREGARCKGLSSHAQQILHVALVVCDTDQLLPKHPVSGTHMLRHPRQHCILHSLTRLTNQLCLAPPGQSGTLENTAILLTCSSHHFNCHRHHSIRLTLKAPSTDCIWRSYASSRVTARIMLLVYLHIMRSTSQVLACIV